MSNYKQQTSSDQFSIDVETGEITTTRIHASKRTVSSHSDQQNFTDQPVKFYRPRDYSKKYGKIHNLGAHAMMQMPGCKLSKVMLLMLRDSTFKGICYTNSTIVAKELGVDIEYARKLLKKVEDHEFAIKVESGNGFYYLINPMYYVAGDEDDEQISRAMWASAVTKREKAKRRKPHG